MKGTRLQGYFSLREAGELLGITKKALIYLINTGELNPQYIDSQYIISDKEIDRFKAARAGTGDNRYKVK